MTSHGATSGGGMDAGSAADGNGNQWADPEGYERGSAPIRYRIRDASGRVVERRTELTLDPGRQRYYHAMPASDQPFADAIVALIQRACSYFYEPDGKYQPLEGVPEVVVSDEEVRTRIERLEAGENTREAQRTQQRHYPLTQLPFDQQRALVEQIEALKREWRFEIIGPDAPRERRRPWNFG